MFGVLWGLILVAVLVSPALAEEKVDCNNAMTQLEMTTCTNLDWQQADEELNAAYKAAMAKMRETDEFLPEDQRGRQKPFARPNVPGFHTETRRVTPMGFRQEAEQWSQCWSMAVARS